MKPVYLITIVGLALCFQSVHGEERLKLDKTIITGSGELPKVTFVVPWRDTPNTIPDWKPSPTAHPVSRPLDRELYHRQVEYLRQLNEHKGVNTAN